MTDSVDDFLAHYGVPGMKWGRRKGESTKTPSSDDHNLSREIRKKPLRTLTNAEVKKFNERVQMEKKFRELKPESYPSAQVSDFIKGALALAGTAGAIYGVTQSPMGKAAIAAGKAALAKKAGA